MEKELFNLVESLKNGGLKFSIHRHGEDGGHGFQRVCKIYHDNGYCFDIKQEYVCEEFETDQYPHIDGLDADGHLYSYYAEWDGFKKLPLEKAIELIKKEGVFV